MKKFFSLVLALVMALSLTTAAWGAVLDTDVAKIGDTGYGTLVEAVDAVPAGGTATITLLKSTTGAGIKLVSADAKNITFNFGGFTYTCTDPAVGSSGTESQGFHFQAGNTVKMMNGTIDVEDGSAVKMLIQNYCNLTLENMTVDGTNLAPAFYGDPPVAGPRYTVSVNSGAVVIDDTTVIADAGEFAFDTYDSPSYGGTPSVTVTGDSAIVGDVEASGGSLVVEDGYFAGEIVATSDANAALIDVDGGTFAVALPDGAVLPTGKTPVLTTNGTYVLGTPVTTGDKFDLYAATSGMKDALAAGAESVPALSFTNMSANTNQDGSGNLAYIAASNGEYFVKTTNPTVADYAVTVAGKTDVLYYVSVVDVADMQYYATAKAFTNFGTKCGQLYKVDTTKEYYVIEKAETGFALAKDDVSYVVKAGGVNVLVGNEIKTLAATRVDDSNTVLTIDEILGHNWAVTGVKATTTGKTVPTQVTCLNCGAVVTKFYDAATKVPAGTVATAVPGYEQATNTHDAWFFVEPAAASVGGTVVTPSTDKVTSAETFDAGIAMYVGMSVMAAAGSAVVIGKKKD